MIKMKQERMEKEGEIRSQSKNIREQKALGDGQSHWNSGQHL